MLLKDEQIQRTNIEKGNPPVSLIGPCRVGEGILQLSETDTKFFAEKCQESRKSMVFFIPASGSGSRMFQFLYEYLKSPNEDNTANVEYFLNSLDKLALSEYLPKDLKWKIKKGDYEIETALSYILEDHGLNLGNLPKGLVPFHKLSPFVLNPIQSQVIQGQRVHQNIDKFHFTIQKHFETETQESVHYLRKMTGLNLEVEYSYQFKETDVIAFDEKLKPALDESGNVILRPSGHGALLQNLNLLEEDFILIKNIDNIQHWDHHKNSRLYWQVLIGLLKTVQQEIFHLLNEFSMSEFMLLNKKYQLYATEELMNITKDEALDLLNRPTRVCGMVRNIGQPGGGPYWVKEESGVSKQIVEKSQISSADNQIMVRSTHFNPVMLALGSKDRNGKKFNFHNFVDPEKYFVVEKMQEGQKIKYCELPGLWNGSMSKWNTLFVEVPNETFSPVKSMLDLLHPMHQPIKENI
jgi:hypothetical protein